MLRWRRELRQASRQARRLPAGGAGMWRRERHPRRGDSRQRPRRKGRTDRPPPVKFGAGVRRPAQLARRLVPLSGMRAIRLFGEDLALQSLRLRGQCAARGMEAEERSQTVQARRRCVTAVGVQHLPQDGSVRWPSIARRLDGRPHRPPSPAGLAWMADLAELRGGCGWARSPGVWRRVTHRRTADTHISRAPPTGWGYTRWEP